MRPILRIFALGPAILLAAATPRAHASLITYTIQVVASDAFPPGTEPDPVLGAFTVTLDPSRSYLNSQTRNIVTNQLNIPFSQPVTPAFTYDPSRFNGELVIGGTINGANAVTAGTPDFFFIVFNLNTPQPTFYTHFGWSDTGFPEEVDLDQVGGAVTQQPIPTPEPATLTLLGTGVIALLRFSRAKTFQRSV